MRGTSWHAGISIANMPTRCAPTEARCAAGPLPAGLARKEDGPSSQSLLIRSGEPQVVTSAFTKLTMMKLLVLALVSVLAFGQVVPAVSKKAPWSAWTRPVLIGHRGGACSQAPEHTLASYISGFDHGVDISECDVCWTKDLVPVCRHEPYLSATTDALSVFPDKVRSKSLDGYNITDVWAEDLTLAELKMLRCNQKVSGPTTNRTHKYDGRFQIVSLEEHIELVLSQGRTIGIIPELKHSTYFNSLDIFKAANTTTMQLLLKTLTKYGYQGPINSPEWLKQPVFIQSFEQNDLVYLTSVSCIPVVQLLDGPGSVTVDRGTSNADMITDAGIDSWAEYSTVFGPWKNSLAAPDASNPGGPLVNSGLCARAQGRGLIVTPYTFRPELNQMAPVFGGVFYNEYEFFLRNVSIDGIWADSASAVTDYLMMEELVGNGWSLNTRLRLNQSPPSCKRPGKENIAKAKLQYPKLFR